MIRDPYQVLGVSPSADAEQIRQAYRRLAKQYHPDLNPGDAAAAKKMNEINEAYDLLKDPQAYRQQQARQQAQQTWQSQSGYYDPFGFYGGNSANRQQNPYQNGYGRDGEEPEFRQYHFYYRPTRRRGPFGLLGKIFAVYLALEILFSLLGGCSRLFYRPYYGYGYVQPPAYAQAEQS